MKPTLREENAELRARYLFWRTLCWWTWIGVAVVLVLESAS